MENKKIVEGMEIQNEAVIPEAVLNDPNTFIVTRELLNVKTGSGEDMYAYYVRDEITIKGQKREFKAEFTVKIDSNKKADFSGYELMDMIFMGGDTAYVTINTEVREDKDTGRKTEYEVYEFWNVDDDGIDWRYAVRPRAESDRAKLRVIRQRKFLKLANAAEAAENAQKTETSEKSKK